MLARTIVPVPGADSISSRPSIASTRAASPLRPLPVSGSAPPSGRCVKPNRSPGGMRCTRWIAVKGSFSCAASADKNTFTFRGRVGGKSLKPGDYGLNSKATDNAHNASSVKRAGFAIVR